MKGRQGRRAQGCAVKVDDFPALRDFLSGYLHDDFVQDHKTPEGHYTIDSRNANSQFHRALHISYPNQLDREQSHRLGVNPGGGIEIHGVGSNYAWLGGLHRQLDWTDGCIAVTDEEIEEIWGLVPVGTPVEIRP